MVNIGSKEPMKRTAVAEGFFLAGKETLDQIEARKLPKGEALAVARVAGIQAAKQCDTLIPLCHSLTLDAVSVSFERIESARLRIIAKVTTTAKTGVEMEALAAVSVTALTLYDMAKSVDRELAIDGIRLVEKTKTEV